MKEKNEKLHINLLFEEGATAVDGEAGAAASGKWQRNALINKIKLIGLDNQSFTIKVYTPNLQ